MFSSKTFGAIVLTLLVVAAPARAATDVVTTIAGTGVAGYAGDGGPAVDARLSSPIDVVQESDGDVLIADEGNNVIRRIDRGDLKISTIAGTAGAGSFGGDGGPATSAHLDQPTGISPTSDGGYLIADRSNNRIREVSPTGIITTVAGSGSPCGNPAGGCGDGGPPIQAELNGPDRAVATADGGFLITEDQGHKVRKVSADGTSITTVAGTGVACPVSTSTCGDGGDAKLAQLNAPNGVAVHPDGGFVISDSGDHRIRTVSALGTITTIAGNGVAGSFGDGITAANANLNSPSSVAVAPNGAIVIADTFSHLVRIVSGDIIRTLAGTSDTPCPDPTSSCGDGGPATSAKLNTPFAVSVTPDGDVLIADHLDNRIRRVDAGLRARCADGLDNDGDELIDFPADPGCSSASDNDEDNAPPRTAPRPVVDGNRLVDSTSEKTFIPRGANWPSFEYACSKRDGGYTDGAAGADTASAMAAWHINTVRIPLNQDCWLGDDGLPASPGGSASGYRAAIKKFSDALKGAGIVTILDLHWTGPDGVVADGQRAMADDRSDDFWTSVAVAYKDEPSVMFDAFNEPYSRVDPATDFDFALTWNCWKDGGNFCGAGAPVQNDELKHDDGTPVVFDGRRFAVTGMTALVQAIRSAGAKQPILLGGLDYANDLTDWLAHRPNDTQLVASFHNYQFNRCKTAQCWDSEIAPVARTVPVVTGEFGETDCDDTYDTSYMKWADAHDVGYLAWAWWVGDPPRPPETPCSQLALLNADGTVRFPNGTALKDHLADLAAGNPPDPPPASTVPTNPVQFKKNTVFTVGNESAKYWIHVPTAYDETHQTPITLFIWLHGCGGKSQYDISNVSGGEAQSYIAIAPGGREGGNGCWHLDVDPARVLSMIADVKTHFNINPRRVVLGGYSSGGDLAYRLVFHNSKIFAGVLAENTSPFSDTGSTQAQSLAAASWKFHVVHLAHRSDNTYPIATVRAETDAMKAAGFPIELIERDGGHYDPDTATSGTEYDLRTLLLPHLNDNWLAPK